MLCKANTLKGYTLDSLDGEIGKVKEFYFDDQHWTIRYLVADTGNWLVNRQVLISPHALVTINKEEHHITINLAKKQIEESPSLESDKPVSRQFEENYYEYYGWPMYWDGPYLWGSFYTPYMVRNYDKLSESTHYENTWNPHLRSTIRNHEELRKFTQDEDTWDPHLRSTQYVSGYHVQAMDDEIGHIEDFVIDDETWTIRYLIINTRNWWPGKKVLISPQWIESVSWGESKVFVNLSRETIKESPEYTDELLLTRDYETGLHRHYKRPGYWV